MKLSIVEYNVREKERQREKERRIKYRWRHWEKIGFSC
jgi:hypothetical protein